MRPGVRTPPRKQAKSRAAATPATHTVTSRYGHPAPEHKDRPFLTFDCSSISENIIESELFGHAAGAFTGAKTERMGLFEAASSGTVFIDELDSLSTQIQGELLRVIEEGEVRRLGENRYREVDVRIITTTKTDLRKAAAGGRSGKTPTTGSTCSGSGPPQGEKGGVVRRTGSG